VHGWSGSDLFAHSLLGLVETGVTRPGARAARWMERTRDGGAAVEVTRRSEDPRRRRRQRQGPRLCEQRGVRSKQQPRAARAEGASALGGGVCAAVRVPSPTLVLDGATQHPAAEDRRASRAQASGCCQGLPAALLAALHPNCPGPGPPYPNQRIACNSRVPADLLN